MAQFAKRLTSLVFPEGALLVALVLFDQSSALGESLATITPHYAIVILAVTAALSARFHHGRILLAAAILALTDLALRSGAIAPIAEFSETERIGLHLLTVLVPLNLAALAYLPERGTRTRAGLVRIGVVAAQAIVVAVLAWGRPLTPATLLARPILTGWTPTWTPLPHSGILAFGLAWGLLGFRLLWRPDVLGRGLLWASVAAFLALHEAAFGNPASIHLGIAGSLLLVSVAESSHALAFRDPLTGLPARRAFDEALSRLRGRRFTVAMVDIDHFKRVNDRHGHDVGDQVLRLVASRLAQARGGGRAYRYGGEEFAILFPGAAKADCVPHLEALREAVASAEFVLRGPDRPKRKPKDVKRRRQSSKAKNSRRERRRTLTVTVSIGAAERKAASDSPDDVVRAADKALYKAKNAGRNRVSA